MKMPALLRNGRSILLLFWIASFTSPAFAEVDNAGILDNVLQRFSNAAAAWSAVVTGRASWLFWTLVVISMVWTFGMMAMRRADIAEFFAEFVRFTVFTGFFWWLLANGPTFAVSIIDSLRQIGGEATGLDRRLAPSGIVDIGFDIFFKVLDQSSVWSPVDSACGITIGAVILVVFALVGVNMLILLISSWILAYAGVFFLGFGGSRWTSEMAIGYFRTVLNIGAQLFAMVLLVGIGKSFVDQYYVSMSAGISLKELGVMLVVAVIMLALVRTIPGLIGGLAGGNTGSLGNGFGAGAALGAAAMGAASLATAGAAVAAGAAGMAGGAQALMTAFSKASAAEGGGGDFASTVTAAAGGTDADTGSGGGSGRSTLAAAMGDTGGSAASSHTSGSFASFDTGTSAAGSSLSTGSDEGTNEKASRQASSFGYSSNATGSSDSAGSKGSAAGNGAHGAKAARIAAGTVTNLAQGSWDVARAKATSLTDTARDRLAQTTGGKIAAAIKARDAAVELQSDSQGFGDDALAQGDSAENPDSEVAAFRDKKS